MDLLCQEALLISGQVPATLQLDLFFPGKNRPQEGDWRQVGTEGSLGGGAGGKDRAECDLPEAAQQ